MASNAKRMLLSDHPIELDANCPAAYDGTSLREQLTAVKTALGEVVRRQQDLRDQTSFNDRAGSRLRAQKALLQEKLGAQRAAITVSDHALVRYLERKVGLDLEPYRDAMLSPAVRLAIDDGADGVKTEEGTFRIGGRTIVTYFSDRKPG